MNEHEEKSEEQILETQPENQPESKPFQRDENGLVVGVDYKYDELGRIDWRAMIPAKYLVPNSDNFTKRSEDTPESIEGLDDEDLIILLGGCQYLANLRGIYDVQAFVKEASKDYACVEYKIIWIPNFETSGNPISCFGAGSASKENVRNDFSSYLVEMAENRAFCRAVKRGLRIDIKSKEELPVFESSAEPSDKIEETASEQSDPKVIQPLDQIKKIIKNNEHLNFDVIKKQMIKEKVSGAETWNNLEDIPEDQVFAILGRIKEKMKKDKK